MPDLGWVAGFHEEARVLNPILLREGWRDWLAASAGGTAEQLLDFELGDGMDRGGLGVLPEALPAQGMPAAAAAISATWQAADRLVPLMPRGLADGLAAAGLLGLLACAPWARSAGAPRCGGRHCCSSLRVFLSAWLGNAALIALGGEVHGRYGARLVWVAPLLADVLALRAAVAATRPDPGAVETLAPPERNRYNPPIDARAAPAVRAVPGKVRW